MMKHSADDKPIQIKCSMTLTVVPTEWFETYVETSYLQSNITASYPENTLTPRKRSSLLTNLKPHKNMMYK